MQTLPVDLPALQAALDYAKANEPAFPYPWEALENAMTAKGDSYFSLIGYGSLISQASASQTINVGEDAARRAVAGFGAKRIFNYRMPAELLQRRYGMTSKDHAIAALNCETSYQVADQFNGILTRVRRDALDALRERERHYALRPIVFLPWGEWSAAPAVAYIFECQPEPNDDDNPYDSSIAPQPEYTALCREGALAISADFQSFFDHTTFLADHSTRLADTPLAATP